MFREELTGNRRVSGHVLRARFGQGNGRSSKQQPTAAAITTISTINAAAAAPAPAPAPVTNRVLINISQYNFEKITGKLHCRAGKVDISSASAAPQRVCTGSFLLVVGGVDGYATLRTSSYHRSMVCTLESMTCTLRHCVLVLEPSVERSVAAAGNDAVSCLVAPSV